MKLIKKLILVFCSLFLTAIIVESTFRLLKLKTVKKTPSYLNFFESLERYPHPFYPGFTGRETGGRFYKYKPNSIWYTKYYDNPHNYFPDNMLIQYRMNSDGFRDYNFPKKQKSVTRILAIGDSITLGQGVKYNDTFSKVLEKKLNETGQKSEVFNLGINGYGIRDQAVILKAFLEKFKTDHIIWGYTLNDISHLAFDTWLIEMEKKKKAYIKDTSVKSYKFIQDTLWKMKYEKSLINFHLKLYESKYWSELENIFNKIFEIIKKENCGITFIIFPDLNAMSKNSYPFRSIHEKLRSFLEKNGITAIDFLNVFNKKDIESLTVCETDPHPNHKAHRIIADNLYLTLKEKN